MTSSVEIAKKKKKGVTQHGNKQLVRETETKEVKFIMLFRARRNSMDFQHEPNRMRRANKNLRTSNDRT